MKKLSLLLIFVSVLFTTTIAHATDPAKIAQFSQEFMETWQAANSARMAGEYDKAVELFEKCLIDKYQIEELDFSVFQSTVHMQLGFLYSNYLNQAEEARVHLEKYIEMTENSPQNNAPGMEVMNAANASMIAAAYRMMGDFEKMVEYLEKSLDLYAAYWESDAPYKMQEADYINTVSSMHHRMGMALDALERPDEAAVEYEKAAQMLLDAEGLAPTVVYHMLGYIYYDLGDMDKSIESYKKYYELRKPEAAAMGPEIETQDKMSRVQLAFAYYEAGKFDEALAELDVAIAAAEELNWTSDVWRMHQLRGQVYEKMDDIEGALAAYKKAIEVVESQRGGLSSSDARGSFMETHIEVYHDIILLLIKLGRPDEALEYFERSKSRAFLDMLGGRKLGLNSPEEQELLEKQVEVQKEINALAQTMIAGAQPGQATDRQVVTKFSDAKRRYDDLMMQVQDMRPEFSSLVSVVPPDIEGLQKMLDDKTVLIEYFPTDEKTFIWIVTSDSMDLRESEDPVQKLEAQIELMRNKITKTADSDSWMRNGKKLYSSLIEPIADDIAGAETLIIVPHGPLHYLPFNALTDGEKYLIDDYVIALAPSISSANFIVEKNVSAGDTLLALGDPETSLPALPAAREEVAEIAGNFSDAMVFQGADAIENLMYEKAGDAELIHVASHGLFYPDKPMFSALALSPDPDGSTDGFLQAHEIFGLDLSGVRLVTLSACETGLSTISGGDELVGLSRAFVYSGTPRVIVSLWTVNDFSTGELMKMMYEQVDTLGPAAALRNAQLELKKNPDFANPFYWAPFQLIGDWR